MARRRKNPADAWWIFGIVAGAGALVAGVAYAASAASAPAPAPAPAGGNQTVKTLTATLAQTGTALSMNVGDTLQTKLLLPTAASSWALTQSDSSVLAPQGTAVQAADAGIPGGTDQIDTFLAASEGTTVLSGAATPGGSFKLTVSVA